MQVLIVDDDDFALSVLENTLGRLGFTTIAARDGRQALEILRRGEIRLMVTDWEMPGMNGIDLCRAVRHEDLAGYVYVIMLTGREGAKQRMEGLCAGADDFLNKPLDTEELLVCLKTAERILALETREVALFALAKLAESRDSETGAHIERVQAYTRVLARNLTAEVTARHGVDDEYVRLLYQTSPLHDLGKVGIPDAVLLKPGKLSEAEFTIMKTHTLIGANTLDSAMRKFPNVRFLQIAREIALSHHEKFDGSGYPHGLVGEQIPLCARIVALADVYDAVTSRRVYKNAMSHEDSKQIILSDRSRHFDPEIVDAFLRAEKQISAIREQLRDDGEHVVQPPTIPSPPEQNVAPEAPIMVVDDDPIVRAKVMELISATGESAIHAADGTEALRMLAKYRPRIVIADWVMPNMDGMELCRQIRARPESASVHFIMLTAHSEKSRLLDAYRAGVDDFLSKPFDQEEFLARVRAGLRASKLREESLSKAQGSHAVNAQLATMNSRLERLSVTDELTGLFNRRHAMSTLEQQWALAERFGRPLTMAAVDIDHFKRINDTYGHDAGDVVLRRVAAILRDECKGTDTLARVGGEEFGIIFPSQVTQEAYVCAERCRQAIELQAFAVHGASISATISVGVATRTPEMLQFSDLLKAADEALYSAKHAGRNAIRTAEQVRQKSHMEQPHNISGTTSISATLSGKPPINAEAVLKRCGGDQKFANAVTEKFQKQAINEVVRIEKALASQDVETVARAAHSLKSMAAYMGAENASSLSKQIEDLGHEKRLSEVVQPLAQLRMEVERTVKWIDQQSSACAA